MVCEYPHSHKWARVVILLARDASPIIAPLPHRQRSSAGRTVRLEGAAADSEFRHDGGVLFPSPTRPQSGRTARPIRLMGLAILAATMLLCLVQSATGAAWADAAAQGAVPLSRATPWQWPIAAPRVVVRPFVAPASQYGAGHRGIDIAAPSGAAVFAPVDGVVHFAGRVVDRGVLSIEHSGGLISSFEPIATTLMAGMPVHRGDTIGTVEPGHCAAVCLHFGVRLRGQYVSPLNYLGGIPRSVLLPTRPIS